MSEDLESKYLRDLRVSGGNSIYTGSSWQESQAFNSAKLRYDHEEEQKSRRKEEPPVEFSPDATKGLVVIGAMAAIYFNPVGVLVIVLFVAFLFLFFISVFMWPIAFIKMPQVAGAAFLLLIAFAFLFRNSEFAQVGPLTTLHYYSDGGGTPADGFLAIVMVGMTLLPWSPAPLALLFVLVQWVLKKRWSLPEMGRASRLWLSGLAPLSMLTILAVWFHLTEKNEPRTLSFFLTDDPLANVASVFFLFGIVGVVMAFIGRDYPREDPMEDLRRRAREQMEQMEQEAEEASKK